MKLFNLFTKTRRSVTEDSDAISHSLLVRAGFINRETAGVYSLLPLGLRVLKNIEKIIREEMNDIGSQEILMPALQPKKNWTLTGRWDSVDVLYKLKSRWGSNEYALGPTHEEIVFPLIGKFVSSYKDLPLSVYQIQTKFRDEKRAKSGIIRGREFGMKDMYSFHTSQEDLNSFYETAKEAYLKIFERMGINAKVTKASGGDFTNQFSHEFMALSEAGEDRIISCSSCHYAENTEVSNLEDGSPCPVCNSRMELRKAIEIGNIFDLGQRFSQDFKIFYVDEKGERKHPFSGCYGIGTTRLIGAIVESSNDEKGIIWPEEVSPYDFHLLNLRQDREAADKIYQKLSSSQHSVLYDDRTDVSPGVKFNDADLIGISRQIVVGENIELVSRSDKKAEIIDIDKIDSLL